MFNLEHVTSAIIGAITGAGISILYSWRQKSKEYQQLILAFCSELVLNFERCVQYYRQSKTGEISYSALFSFIDSSALSKFASSCKKPEIIPAIVELKSMYFQIQRHVEEAAKFALEASRSNTVEEKQHLMVKAIHAQGTAIAFFNSFYGKLENLTALITRTTQQISPGGVAWDLSTRFLTAKDEKKKTDCVKLETRNS